VWYGHLTVLLVAVLLLSALLTVVAEQMLYRQKASELRELGVPIASELGKGNPVAEQDVIRLSRLLNEAEVSVIQLDAFNRPVFPESAVQKGFSLPDDVWNSVRKGNPVEGTNNILRLPVTWVVMPLGSGGERGALLLYSPVEGTVKAIRQMRLALLFSALLSLVVSLAVSYWFSKGVARRIERLRQVTFRLREGNYGVRIPEEGSSMDEIAALAEDFNLMAARLEETHRELEAFEQNRRQFLLDLSHELRTPLTSIRGWLEALRKGFADEAEKPRIYANMEREVLRLIRLIHELMDLEKIRAGKVELAKGVYPVRELFELVADQLAWMAEEKGLTIRIDLAAGEEPQICGDYDRLLQILVNLVKNGIQFTEAGEITLSARQEAGGTTVTVRDTGIGMTKEELERMWERFFKADPSRARRGGETGLGLAIVKQLVEAHGGHIFAESEPGRGTAVTFILPFS
jgi:signal transduction histidine kinase